MKQELLTLAEQLGSSPVILLRFVLLDLWFCVWCFVDRCLSFCPFSFGYCVVCPSIYTIFITHLVSSNNRFLVFISPYSISHFVHEY